MILSSFFACIAGFYFREHYFVLLLPAASLLIGITFSRLDSIITQVSGKAFWGAWLSVGLFIGINAGNVVQQIKKIGEFAPDHFMHDVYGTNPFSEAIPIAKYLHAHTVNADKIAVLGSEPEIYFYAKRRSATAYIYMYPLMESSQYAKGMQLELVGQIEKAKPKYIVYVNLPTSWLSIPASERFVFEWARKYLNDNYIKTMAICIRGDGGSDYFWDSDARERVLPSDRNVEVYELRTQ